MSSKTQILWVDGELAEALPLVRAFEPVMTWDNEKRQFLDVQQVEDGQPVWEGQALLPVGWGRELTPIRVRMLSATRPAITPDPSKLMPLLAGGEVEL